MFQSFVGMLSLLW